MPSDAQSVKEMLAGDAQLQSAWEGTGDPPDGEYQAIVNGFEFFDSTKNDEFKQFLKISLQIAHDETWEGKVVEKVYRLDNPELLDWLLGDLTLLGIGNTTVYAEFIDRLPEVLDVPVAIALKTGDKGYQNLYLNKRLGGPLGKAVDTDLAEAQSEADGAATREEVGF